MSSSIASGGGATSGTGSSSHMPTTGGGVGVSGPAPPHTTHATQQQQQQQQQHRTGAGGIHGGASGGGTGGGYHDSSAPSSTTTTGSSGESSTTGGGSSTAEGMIEHASKRLPQAAQEQGRYVAEQGRQTMEQGREMAAPYIEKGKELRDTLMQKAAHTSDQMQHQVQMATDAACGSYRDIRGFFRRHPVAVLSLLTMGLLAGMGTMLLGLSLGWTGKQLFGGHVKGSPQYEAHQALESILQSTIGDSSSSWSPSGGHAGGWTDSATGALSGLTNKLSNTMGLPQQHPQQQQPLQRAASWIPGLSSTMQQQQQTMPGRAQDAYHYMGDTWRSVKDRMMPDGMGSDQQGSHAGAGGGGMTGFLGDLKERVVHPFGSGSGASSEWQKVEQAQQRLREALHAAAQHGGR